MVQDDKYKTPSAWGKLCEGARGGEGPSQPPLVTVVADNCRPPGCKCHCSLTSLDSLCFRSLFCKDT